MACERNSIRAAEGAARSGISKTASKNAAAAGAAQGKEGEKGKIDPQARAKKRALTARNVKTFHEAIKQQRRVSVYYRPVSGKVRKYGNIVPLDVKGGSSPQTKRNRYMWAFSEKSSHPLCMRLNRVVKVEKGDEPFEPKIVAKRWKGKKVTWNLPRDPEAGWNGQRPGKTVR
ncbi:MAG: hypothetical protein DPW09_33815 [Anaerolineae bacterium]|nr:hypothetical protein [Anaerolineae bacterium]